MRLIGMIRTAGSDTVEEISVDGVDRSTGMAVLEPLVPEGAALLSVRTAE